MNMRRLLLSALLLALLYRPLSLTAAPAPPPPNAESAPLGREARMAWFRDARFGMFIHWGPYSALGGEYRGQPVGWIAEWIQHTARIPLAEYETMAHAFNPVKFDAREWVSLAREAGMKYIAITAKHHDGFCLWDTRLTGYNLVQGTPFHRDAIAELARECERQGLKFGVYYSVRDWHHPDWPLRYEHLNPPHKGYGYAASPWTSNWVSQCGCPSCRKSKPFPDDFDPRPVAAADMNRYLDYMRGQLTELLTRCGPVSLMWFDAQDIRDPALGRVKEMIATMRRLNPNVIISDRIGPDGTEFGDYGVHEGGVPGTGAAREWETCMTLNNTWGYSKFDEHWKSAAELIHTLVETTSKNGNFLLNVGPDGEGVIPAGSAGRLREVGRWMAENADSIRGCGAANLPVPKWGRFTARGSRLYVHIFQWPADGQLRLPPLPGTIRRAFALAYPARQQLEFTVNPEGVDLRLPVTPAEAGPDAVLVLEMTQP